MRIIVLTGWSQSGKDTAADILVRKYGFTKYAIADPLKDLCADLYGFARELADTQEGKKTVLKVGYKTKTIRELLIDTAKLDRSRFGDDIYIKATLNKIISDGASRVVISDLRYFTELTPIEKFVKQHNSHLQVWKVVRDGQTESPVNDPSEHGLQTLKPRHILENPGTTIQALEEKISEILSRKDELSNPQNEDDGCSIM